MAIGKQVSDRLALVVEVVSDKAEAGLRSLSGKTDTAGDAAEKTTGRFGHMFDRLTERFPMVGKAAERFGISTETAGAVAAGAATAAGTAIAGLAVKAVGDFTRLAGGVLDFQRATQLSAEESSRWVAVLDDYDLSAEQGAGAIGKFAKAVATTPEQLAALGIEVARSADGNVELQKTLANAADAFSSTDDATRRAQIGAAAFGKSWQDMIPLLEGGAVGLTKAFSDVEKAQVLNQDDLANAEEFRLTMDALGDSVQGISIQVGRLLVPALQEAADEIDPLLKAMDWLSRHTGDASKETDGFVTNLMRFGPVQAGIQRGMEAGAEAGEKFRRSLTGTISDLVRGRDVMAASEAATRQMAKAAIDAAEANDVLANRERHATEAARNSYKARHDEADAAKALADKEEALEAARDDAQETADRLAKTEAEIRDRRREITEHANDDVNAELAYRDAHRQTEKAIRDAKKANEEAAKARSDPEKVAAAEEAQDKIIAAVMDEADAWVAMRGKVKDSKDGAQDYANKIAETANQLRDQYPEIAALLDGIAAKWRGIAEATSDATGRAAGYGPSFGTGPIKARADGGPVRAGEPYLIGEEGPELMVPAQSGMVVPNDILTAATSGRPFRPGGSSGGALIINISATDPKGTLDVLQRAVNIAGKDAVRRILGIQ